MKWTKKYIRGMNWPRKGKTRKMRKNIRETTEAK